MTVPHPFTPPLDPVANGVAVLISDSAGGSLLDLVVPGGLFDPVAKAGWKAAPSGASWKYVNRSAAAAAGVTGVAIRDLSRRLAGLVHFSVKGRRGAYPVDPAALPLTALLVLDPPTAETGQCGEATFADPGPGCTTNGTALRCR
jgi:hypothetical protein